MLAPHEELHRRLLGILGRAIALYPVAVHVFQIMPNHFHLLMTVADAKRMADFMAYFKKQAGDAVREIRGVRHVWEGRYWHDCVLTDEEAQARLRYALANGVKEGLVDSPEEWPGLGAAKALVEQRDLVGNWSTAKERRRANRMGQPLATVGTTYVVRLAPVPSLARQSAPRLRAYFYRMCREIEAQGRAVRNGRPAAGAEAVCAIDPMSTAELERRPRARYHRVSRARRAWNACVERVTAEHRLATALRRLGHDHAPYPPGCFAPGAVFVRWPSPWETLDVSTAAARRLRSGNRSPNHRSGPRKAVAPERSHTIRPPPRR